MIRVKMLDKVDGSISTQLVTKEGLNLLFLNENVEILTWEDWVVESTIKHYSNNQGDYEIKYNWRLNNYQKYN